MTPNRREFLRIGSVTAAGAAFACGGGSAPASSASPATVATGPFSVSLQFSGLVVHGSWPVNDASKPNVVSGWDALLVRDGEHKARLRLPLANVKNPTGYVEDRYSPGVGIWDLNNVDLLIRLDTIARGEVITTTGKRRKDSSGKPVTCPDHTNSDEYTDISWLARFSEILPGTNSGAIKDALKGDASTIPKNDLLNARVRLAKGTISCARPSLEDYDEMMFGFSDIDDYGQFVSDLVRFRSADAQAIQLELVPFGTSSGSTIDLVSTGGTVVGFVENIDPLLAQRVLNGMITLSNFWMHHFDPYYKLLKYTGQRTYPKPAYCTTAGDPPFYCISPGGSF